MIDISSVFCITGGGVTVASGSLAGGFDPDHVCPGLDVPDVSPVDCGFVGFLRRSSKSHIRYRVIKVLRLS